MRSDDAKNALHPLCRLLREIFAALCCPKSGRVPCCADCFQALLAGLRAAGCGTSITLLVGGHETVKDFLAQQRDHCINIFGDLCAKMHDYAFTSVTLTDHLHYGFRQGLANPLDATGKPIEAKHAQHALKSLSTSGKDFELVLVKTDFHEWVRNVAKVGGNLYNFGRMKDRDVVKEVSRLLAPDPATSGAWPWMAACFQAVPEALRKGIHVVMFSQGRVDQLDLATGKSPTRQFTLPGIRG
eukprot:s2065_g5.t1